MSITAYKVEAVGHDRTGTDYGYVNIMYRYGNKNPALDRISARKSKSCGRTRVSTDHLLPAAR